MHSHVGMLRTSTTLVLLLATLPLTLGGCAADTESAASDESDFQGRPLERTEFDPYADAPATGYGTAEVKALWKATAMVYPHAKTWGKGRSVMQRMTGKLADGKRCVFDYDHAEKPAYPVVTAAVKKDERKDNTDNAGLKWLAELDTSEQEIAIVSDTSSAFELTFTTAKTAKSPAFESRWIIKRDGKGVPTEVEARTGNDVHTCSGLAVDPSYDPYIIERIRCSNGGC